MKKVDYTQAIEALLNGKIVKRSIHLEGTFIFRQVPSEIFSDVIPKMTSLPQSVKDEFAKREATSIKYNNQFAIVDIDNNIQGWKPEPQDFLAKDWIIIE